MLTRKQAELLRYIDDQLRATGISPSFEEMKDAMDLRSKSGVHRLITALVERGFLARHANRARALEVLRLPEGLKRGSTVPATLARPAPANDVGAVEIPYHGRIAAGSPIEALPGTSVIAVPAAITLVPERVRVQGVLAGIYRRYG